MNPLLLSGFANSINVDGGRLVVTNRLENTRIEFYPHRIEHDSIIIDGPTGNITFEAIRWLMAHGINVTVLNWNGKQIGSILPRGPKDGQRRLAQYRTYFDKNKRYEIASAIIECKIKHSFNMLIELSKYYCEIHKSEVTTLFNKERGYYLNNSHTNLLMYEGRIADYYWQCFRMAINKAYPDSHFESRKNKSYSYNMNASDPVNALLNWGYAVLESQIRKNINSLGLEPTIGFLHEPDKTKEPLVYDLQELGRWLIDLSVIQLLETTKLRKNDFIVTENYTMRLRPETARLLLEKIRINFNRKVPFKNGKSFTYQTIFYDAANQLIRFIESDKLQEDFSFNIPFAKIDRNDSTDIAQKILTMSESERKRLGISKAGLWYQKKKIREGQKVRIYKKVFNKIDAINNTK